MPTSLIDRNFLYDGYLERRRAEQDTFLDKLIAAASKRLIRYTGRHFFPTPALVTGNPPTDTNPPVAKTFTVRSSSFVRVPDLRTVSSVVLGGMTLDASDPYPAYELWGAEGEPHTHIRILRAAVSPFASSNILTITGRWGFLEVPDDVKDACATWVARAYKKKDANYADTVQQGIEGAAFQYLNQIPAEIKMTMDSYRASGPNIALI
jgi:hypothetical protein